MIIQTLPGEYHIFIHFLRQNFLIQRSTVRHLYRPMPSGKYITAVGLHQFKAPKMASINAVKPPGITKMETIKLKANQLPKLPQSKAPTKTGIIATAGKGEKKPMNVPKEDNPRIPTIIQLEEDAEEEDGIEIVKKLDFDEEETFLDSSLGGEDYGNLSLDYDEQETDSGNETQVSFSKKVRTGFIGFYSVFIEFLQDLFQFFYRISIGTFNRKIILFSYALTAMKQIFTFPGSNAKSYSIFLKSNKTR